MNDFDKEFDAAPDATFDDAFEKAPDHKPEQPEQSFLDKESPLGPSLRQTGETLHDAALGATQGMTLGAADEVGGAASAGLDHLIEKISGMIPGTDQHKLEQLKEQGFQMPEQSLADKYKMYQKNAEGEFTKADERSPWAYGIGQLGGGLATNIGAAGALGVFNGAKHAKSIKDIAQNSGYAKAALESLKRGGTSFLKGSPLMALEGVTNSKGSLINGTDKEKSQVGSDVVNNLAYGLPAVIGMQGAGDVLEPLAKAGVKKAGDFAKNVIDDSDFLQQMKIMHKYGEQGINPVSRKNAVNLTPGGEGLIKREGTRAQGLMDKVLDADNKLGQDVGNSLHQAEKAGIRFNINPIIDNSFSKITSNVGLMEELGENSNLRKILNRISTKGSSDLSPLEAKTLMDDVDATIKRIGSYKAPPPEIEKGAKLLSDFRSKLDQEMRKQIKPYDLAKTRFHEFRQLVPETILSGETPQDISKVWMGDLKNPEKDMYNRIKGLTKYSTASGSANAPVKEALENTVQGMHKWEANELARGTKNPLNISAKEFSDTARDYANDAAARRSASTTAESRAFGTNLATAASGFGQAPRSMMMGASNIVGRTGAVKGLQSVGAKARNLYNLPADKLHNAADRLLQMPRTKVLGQSLKDALNNGDSAKKNAALFMIMQNPEANNFFNSDEED